MNSPEKNIPARRRTRTLAKLYADQGHFDKAIEICRHLVRDFPERKDIEEIKQDIADMEGRRNQIKTARKPKLPALITEWLELIKKYRQSHGISLPK